MTRFSLLAGMTISALTISNVVAQTTHNWEGGDGSNMAQWQDWARGGNWSSNSVPATGDIIVIPNVTYQPIFPSVGVDNSFAKLTIQQDAEMTIDEEAVFIITGSTGADLDIVAGAELYVNADAQLQFTSGSATATIGGELRLLSGSALVVGNLTGDTLAFSGNGFVDMTSATVQIEADKVLSNNLVGGFAGSGQVYGVMGTGGAANGLFKNMTKVTADINGATLTFPSNTKVEDFADSIFSDGDWIVENGATLSLNRSAVDLGGNILANNGTISFAPGILVITLGDAHVGATSTISLGNGAEVEVDGDLTDASGGLVSACGANTLFLVNGAGDFSSLNDNRWLFGSGLQNDCP